MKKTKILPNKRILFLEYFFMEDRDDYYERIQEIPYETIESAKKELFETLE
ncbi:hypothetical protein IJU97_03135 [bacterium]|nr:hypothetical protein [bacterium]